MAGYDSQQYRDIIDRLVWACRVGQGQIGARRARAGVWNANATAEWSDGQYEFNQLLASLDESKREVLAAMLAGEFVGGIHQALVVLHEAQIEPFQGGYEGSPFNDFIGRLADWPWPEH